MKLRTHLLSSPEIAQLDYLKGLLNPGISITTGKKIINAPGVDVIVAGRPERKHLVACQKLKALIIPFAGIPATTLTLLEEFPELEVYNLHHNAAITAEMAITLLLAAVRFIIPADQRLRLNDWTTRYNLDPSMTLDGKKALILGFGHIGQRIGRVCYALGMEINAVRRNLEKPCPSDYPVTLYEPEQLMHILSSTDVLIIALPGTPLTEGIIGYEELSVMPKGGVLVNIGRGSIVNQAALFESLKNKHLRTAGLDVWYNYPKNEAEWSNTPPADYPFGDLDNVVISPHRAGGVEDIEPLRMVHLSRVLNSLCNREIPPNRVDISLGY